MLATFYKLVLYIVMSRAKSYAYGMDLTIINLEDLKIIYRWTKISCLSSRLSEKKT